MLLYLVIFFIFCFIIIVILFVEMCIYFDRKKTISDHSPQYSFVPNVLSKPPTQKSNYYERDWSKFKQENFILDYFDKDWTDLLQIDQQNVNLPLDSFFKNINSILDVHAPLKKVNKYKLKFKTKPWITLAFQKSISSKRSSSKRKISKGI